MKTTQSNGTMSANQIRMAARIPKVRGYHHCPDCKFKTPYATTLGKHRHDEHGYKSPVESTKKSAPEHFPMIKANPEFVDLGTGKLIKQPDDLFHCPEGCGFSHTHATSLGWHRRKQHGIKGVNAHRTKKKIRLDEQVMQEMAATRRRIMTEEATPVVYTGCNHCPNCGYNLKPFNTVSLLAQRAMETGQPYSVSMTFKSNA